MQLFNLFKKHKTKTFINSNNSKLTNNSTPILILCFKQKLFYGFKQINYYLLLLKKEYKKIKAYLKWIL